MKSNGQYYRENKEYPGQGYDEVEENLHAKSPKENGTPEVGVEPAEGAKENAENDAGALEEEGCKSIKYMTVYKKQGTNMCQIFRLAYFRILLFSYYTPSPANVWVALYAVNGEARLYVQGYYLLKVSYHVKSGYHSIVILEIDM